MATATLAGPDVSADDVTIRTARARDIPLLEWHGEFWHLRGTFDRTFREQVRARKLILIADAGSYPVGRAFLHFARGHPLLADGHSRAYLYSLHILEAFRGHGIGTQLIASGEQQARRRGFTCMTIAVAKANPRAMSLYTRLGYRTFTDDPGTWTYVDPTGVRHFVHEPAWLLQKPL